MTEELNIIRKELKKELDHNRYEHTLGVMYTAASLAMRYNEDMNRAMTAGLLHDCAKCIPNNEKIVLCEKYHIPIRNIERESPFLLHAKLGAYLAKNKYQINDNDILHAIEVHTTGCIEMNTLDKIIFIADYIEPNRDKAPRLEEIRREAFENMDRCIYSILYDTLHFLNQKKGAIDTTTQTTFDYYKQLVGGN